MRVLAARASSVIDLPAIGKEYAARNRAFHAEPTHAGTLRGMSARQADFAQALKAVLILIALTAPAAAAEGLDPEDALKSFHLSSDLLIQLVASEPEVVDPVAIAFDESGRMFVVEMRDYPNGPAQGKPFTSRVKLLEDRDGDGRYELSAVFADELPFANGVMPWKGGVLVTAAPDILYLKDADGDGKAEIRGALFTGFALGNPQLRVNHPTLGIDNWIYVANGLSGGAARMPDQPESAAVPLKQMDFRFRPDQSAFEATPGNAQFGLAFDDRGNRFVCSNRQHADHVVLPDHYLKRNPFLTVATGVHNISDHGAAARLFPLTSARTTAVEHAGSFTAACGLVLYRGSALGDAYRGNAFVCDPTGNLVHRDLLSPAGASFHASRAPEEARREFLASTDEWFRPVNLANGPDGALYVVDMYRETIEHPQYMPKGLPETLDLRRGSERGRIYRITGARMARAPRARPDLGRSDARELAAVLEHQDAWWRETAQRLLIERQEPSAIEPVRALLRSSSRPVARLHALRTLEGLEGLDDAVVAGALEDTDPSVREHALHLAESRLNDSPALRARLLVLAGDPDARVRFQAAFSIGAITRDRPVQSLAKILERDVQDPWTQTAVLSSVNGVAGRLWLILVDPSSDFLQASGQAKAEFVARLASVIGARNDQDELRAFLQTLAVPADVPTPWWQMAALTGLADGIKQRGATLAAAVQELADSLRGAAAHVSQLLDAAKQIAQNAQRDLTERSSAIRLMGHMPFDQVADDFRGLLEPQQPQEIQLAAVQSLGTISDPRVAALLLEGWERYSPPVRREVLEAAFSRRERVAALLDAVEAGSIKATELDTARHAQLLNYPLKEIKTRAERLFAAQGTPNRKEVIESFRPLLTQTGDAVRGQNVFMKQCATCHRIAGAGQLVGPELTGLRSRSREAILMDMLDPNRALSPNYTNYLVATRDGRVLSGLIASETASSITLRRAEGAEDLLLRRDIESVRATGQSLMPEGLERNMTPEEMVDLIEFLKTVP